MNGELPLYFLWNIRLSDLIREALLHDMGTEGGLGTGSFMLRPQKFPLKITFRFPFGLLSWTGSCEARFLIMLQRWTEHTVSVQNPTFLIPCLALMGN